MLTTTEDAQDAPSSVDDALTFVDVLRRDLVARRFGRNEHLVEANLARDYGAARAEVRAAIVTLAAEGLVEREPNRGARVRSLSLQDAIEIAETRQELEALCTGSAATHANAEERSRIRELLEELRGHAAGSDIAAYRTTSVLFHESIAEAAHHPTAQRLLVEIRNHKLAEDFPEAFLQNGLGHSFPDHEGIADAVLAGDREAAAAAMYEHVGKIVTILRNHERALAATS